MLVRFNLDKENDGKLFEELNKRTDSGKRNEFVKQVLFDCLVNGGKGIAPALNTGAKKQQKMKAVPPVKLPAPGVVPPPTASAAPPGPVLEEPVASDRNSREEVSEQAEGPAAAFLR